MISEADTCVVVLQTLTAITRHGGVQSRHDVARIASPEILKSLQENSSSPEITRLAVSILAHTVAAIYATAKPIFHQFPMIKMTDVIEATHSALANSSIDFNLFSHSHKVISSATRHLYSFLEKHQPSLDFLVGTIRSSDFSMRMNSVRALLRLYLHHHVQDDSPVDPEQMLVGMKNLPDHLVQILSDYGLEQSDTQLSITSSREYLDAQMKTARTRDFFELGLVLGDLVTKTKSHICQGWFKDANGGPKDLGLPYSNLIDALPVAAAALRQRDPIKYADMADMIDLYFFSFHGHISQLITVSETAMKRSSHAFWYYMRAKHADEGNTSPLRWCKLGLKCTNTTNYIRHCLLERAARHAAEEAICIMVDKARTPENLNLIHALLRSALDDSMAFVREAPPDCDEMQSVITLALVLTFLLKEKELSLDLRELKASTDGLRGKSAWLIHL